MVESSSLVLANQPRWAEGLPDSLKVVYGKNMFALVQIRLGDWQEKSNPKRKRGSLQPRAPSLTLRVTIGKPFSAGRLDNAFTTKQTGR